MGGAPSAPAPAKDQVTWTPAATGAGPTAPDPSKAALAANAGSSGAKAASVSGDIYKNTVLGS